MKRFVQAASVVPESSVVVGLLDRLLPAALSEGSELDRGRARALVGNIAVALFACLAVGMLSAAYGDGLLAVVVGVAAVWFSVTWVVLHRVRDVRTALALYVIGASLAYVSAITASGGLRSPLVVWIPVYPVLLVSVAGARGGFGALVFTAVTVVLWRVAAAVGVYDGLASHAWWDTSATAIHGVVAASVILLSVLTREFAVAALILENAEVWHARAAAEAESRAKTEFLAAVSHEIRTPMTGMLGVTEILADTPLDADQAELVRTLRATGDVLVAVVDDLLDTARLETGRMHLAELPVDLRQVVERVVALFGPTARERGLVLVTRIAPRVPMRVSGDPVRLQQVLVNLVSNALKYTARGRISVVIVYEAGVARISVEDTGVGIPDEVLQTIFEPFVQASAVRDRTRGAGLGLAIARMLVERMGGTLGVESRVGLGTKFHVDVPLAELAYSEVTADEVTLEQDLVGLRVLVADDNPVNQVILRRLVESIGHEVVVVGDGEAAVRAVADGVFDVVLMDLHMPGMGGLEATRHIRAMGRPRPPHVLGLTAAAESEVRVACLEAGMDAVVTKPVSRELLRRTIAGIASGGSFRTLTGVGASPTPPPG